MKLTIEVVIAVVLWVAVFGRIKDVSAFERKLHRTQRAMPTAIAVDLLDKWFTQKLDHFDNTETKTWQMRYLSNDQYFIDGGPMFILLGGESEILQDSLLDGHFVEIAKEHKGYLFHTEYRYYGKSRPTSDLSTANLKYLNASQAVADVAKFIQMKKAEIPGLANSKVIVAGGSYGGSLVVWLKRLHPEFIDGGWASGAPLLAKMNFFESKEVIGEALRVLGGQHCYNSIRNGITTLENMFANNRSTEALSLLRICEDGFNENNDLDLWSVFAVIAGAFHAYLAKQMDGDISLLCNSMLEQQADVDGVIDVFLQMSGTTTCDGVSYKYLINIIEDTTYSHGVRQMFYQSCNEFGWFMTSDSREQPFGSKFPSALFTSICADVFGKEFSSSHLQQNIERTNKLFGGLNPNVENVYITYGEFDFWRPVGQHNGTIIIPSTSHVQDLKSISLSDSDALKVSKEKIAELVRKWVGGSSK